MKLWIKIIFGILSGVVLGLVLGENAVFIKPLGDLFIRLIKMIIAPLIFFAIIGGITSAQDKSTLGRLGAKAAFVFVLTTFFAILIGFSTAWLFKPGANVVINFNTAAQTSSTSIAEILSLFLNIIPDNAIAAMSQGHILQIVFFAIFTGLTIHTLPGEIAKRVTGFMHLMQSLVFAMVSLIVKLAPIAACAFIAWIIGTQDPSTLKGVLKFYGCIIFACSVQYFLFGFMIWMVAKVSPFPFFRKCIGFQSIAFATTSSKAALAHAISTAQDKLGVSNASSSFLIPMGATLNMDGFAIYLGMSGIFIAQALGKTMGIQDYIVLVLTSTLGTIGGAGIPGGAIVVLPMILSALGLPVEGVAIIAGIDRLIDPFTTTINITGDVAVTLCVDASEKTFNPDLYHKT